MNAKITTFINESEKAQQDSYKQVLDICKANIFAKTSFEVVMCLEQDNPYCTIKAKVADIEYDNYDKLFYAKWDVSVELNGEINTKTAMWDQAAEKFISCAIEDVRQAEKSMEQEIEL